MLLFILGLSLCFIQLASVDVAPYAAARGLLRTVHNISHDPLYVGPDCADYEAQLRATGPGVYESIVGAGSGTICSSDA